MDEILRLDGRTGEPSEYRQLTGMRHRVGEGSLQKLLRRDSRERRVTFKMAGEVLESRVKPHDLGVEIRKRLLMILAADEESSRVAENAFHVPDEFERGSDFWRDAEREERFRRIAQGFPRAVGECGKEVT